MTGTSKFWINLILIDTCYYKLHFTRKWNRYLSISPKM